MSMYYDGGSMRGSGIYSETVCKTVMCPECSASWEDDFTTDDWGRIEEEMVCYKCNTDFYFETSLKEA